MNQKLKKKKLNDLLLYLLVQYFGRKYNFQLIQYRIYIAENVGGQNHARIQNQLFLYYDLMDVMD